MYNMYVSGFYLLLMSENSPFGLNSMIVNNNVHFSIPILKKPADVAMPR